MDTITDDRSAATPPTETWRADVDSIYQAFDGQHPSFIVGYLASFIARHGLTAELVNDRAGS